MNEQSEHIDQKSSRPASGKTRHTVVPKHHFKRLGRELSMQFLFECDLAGMDGLAEKLANFWAQAEQSGEFSDERTFRKARTYAEKIISGVCAHETEIDEVISKISDRWDISRMSAVDRNIIRVAIFEIYYCPDIPALVSIDEAIEIAKDYSSEKAGNFINGLLNAVKDHLPRHAQAPGGTADPK